MGFKKIKAKVKKARGGGPDATVETLAENWDEWKASFGELNDDEKSELVDKFEDACTGAGDALAADSAAEFTGEASSWAAEDKQKFHDLLVPDYFELE